MPSFAVPPSDAACVSRDSAFRKLVSDQIRRQPPRLTIEGFRRAIQLYGNEPNLLRALKSHAFSYTSWKAENASIYRDFSRILTNEGYDLRLGYADGKYYRAPGQPPSDHDCLTKQGDFQLGIPRQALFLTPATSGRSSADTVLVADRASVPVSSSESSSESDVLLPSIRQIGKTSQSTPSRPNLPATLRDLAGNVFYNAGDAEANALGCAQLATILLDTLQAAVSSELSVAQEAEIQGIMAVMQHKDSLPAIMASAERAFAASREEPAIDAPVFGLNILRGSYKTNPSTLGRGAARRKRDHDKV